MTLRGGKPKGSDSLKPALDLANCKEFIDILAKITVKVGEADLSGSVSGEVLDLLRATRDRVSENTRKACEDYKRLVVDKVEDE